MPSETGRLSHLLSHLVQEDGRTVARFSGMTLSSHFQPIFSLSHARVVGHEGLLRAHDASGRPVPPPAVFRSCRSEADMAACDQVSRIMHMSNFVAQAPQAQWVFLNIHPTVFQRLAVTPGGGDAYLREVFFRLGLPPEQMVLEVLETDVTDLTAMEEAMAAVRRAGSLIAIDDFGAGQSNFDRVWRLQPDIVKLDRSLVTRAARDRRTQRVVAQMVSLLHECGAMVLMEGIETLDEAMIAMESDADLAQGYYFGRPQPLLVPNGHAPERITALYPGLGARRDARRSEHRQLLEPYRLAIADGARRLAGGTSLEQACREFLDLPGAELAYVLDAEGNQTGAQHWPSGTAPTPLPGYEPLARSDGACWARRPYFRRAIESVGQVQTTRPYRTLHGKHLCVTVSYAFVHDQDGHRELRVLCGDMVWDERPDLAGGTP